MSANCEMDGDALREYMLELTFRLGYSRWNFNLRSLIHWYRYNKIAVEVQRASNEGFVLDVGCGFGQITKLLEMQGVRVVGIDIGGESRKSNRVWKYLKGTYVHADACNLPFVSGIFDTVVCCGVMEHVYNEEKFLDQCNTVLRSGGSFLCYYLPSSTGLEFLFRKLLGTSHERVYDRPLILRLFASHGFKVIDIGREHLIPLPHALALLYPMLNKAHRILLMVEDLLMWTPLRFFSGNWRIRATKS